MFFSTYAYGDTIVADVTYDFTAEKMPEIDFEKIYDRNSDLKYTELALSLALLGTGGLGKSVKPSNLTNSQFETVNKFQMEIFMFAVSPSLQPAMHIYIGEKGKKDYYLFIYYADQSAGEARCVIQFSPNTKAGKVSITTYERSFSEYELRTNLNDMIKQNRITSYHEVPVSLFAAYINDMLSGRDQTTIAPVSTVGGTAAPKPTAKNTSTPLPTPASTEIPVLVAPDGSWTCYRCGRIMKTNFCTHCGSARPTPIPTPTPTPTPVPTPAPWTCPACGEVNKDRYCGNCGAKNPNVSGITLTEGDIFAFGRYPQTEAGDDQTPIEWIVLEVRDGKALLLSRYGLDAKPYNKEMKGITWENSTIRNWLNGEFMDRAFTEGERSGIVSTDVDNSGEQGYSEWSAEGGNNTEDMVFLLSYAEANRYFGVTREDMSNIRSRVSPTAYASVQGAKTFGYKTTEDLAAGWWWLRSPALNQYIAAYVNYDGSLGSSGVIDGSGCIRPALWIDLEAGIF